MKSSVKGYLAIAGLLLTSVTNANSNDQISALLGVAAPEHPAAAQLIRSQLPSGYFPYDFNFSNGAQSDMNRIEGFNLVRQAATAYGLVEYYAAFKRDDSRKAVERFLHIVEKNSLLIGKSSVQKFLEQTGLYNRWQLWGPLRQPLYDAGLLYSEEGSGHVVSVEGDYERAWTGATALSLLTAVKYFETTSDTQFNPAINRWLKGLLALHVPGRGFRVAPHYLSESAYFNGEAWLALAEYVESFPEDQDSNARLEQLDDYLLGRYGGKSNMNFYSWGTMAAAVRSASTDDPRFVEFAIGLARLYLEEQSSNPTITENSCDLVEGLATFVALMKRQGLESDPVVVQINQAIEQLMAYNRQLQINLNSGAALAVQPQYISRLDEYIGAFILSPQEPIMRIDMTMHCINALLRMKEAGITH